MPLEHAVFVRRVITALALCHNVTPVHAKPVVDDGELRLCVATRAVAWLANSLNFVPSGEMWTTR